LVVLSPAAVDSHNVMDEVSFALEERKTLLPVLHRRCDIPFRLRRVQYIDFTNDYSAGLDRVLGTFGIQHAVHEPVQTVPEATQQPPHDPSRTMDADVSEAALLRFRALTKRCKGLGLVDDVIVDQLVSRGLKREKAVELVKEKA